MLLSTAAMAIAADDLAPFLASHQKASALAAEKKWAEAAKAYGGFAAEQGDDPCAPVASALQGIILRRELNQPAQAREAFLRAAKAPDTPFGRAVREMARGWLARLQMEQLDAALRRYWTDKIEYPEKLDALVARKLATPELIVDPWGKPFSYAARPLKARPDLPRQVYTLACTAIEEDSRGLKAAFAHTFAFPKRFQLKAIGGVKPLVALIAFEDKAKKAVNVAEGEKADGATLVRLTPQGAILIQGCAIAVLAK